MQTSLPVLVSVDSHFAEPEDLWTSRLPEDLQYRAPAYRRVNDQTKLWVANGRVISKTDEYRRYYREGTPVAVSPLLAGDELSSEPIERDDLEGRWRDMEVEGVWAETIHPNVGLFLFDMEDVAFHVRCAQIYNDYVAERFDHKRLLPNALIPVQDVDAAVKEIKRVAELGIRGLELPLTAPEGRPWFLDLYDPIWQAATDVGLPIAMHAGTGNTGGFAARATTEGDLVRTAGNRQRALISKRTALGGFGTMLMASCYETMAHLVGGGVLERFPDLHFFLVETGASWLAFVLDSMDTAWTGATVGREVNRTFFKLDGSPVTQFAEDELFKTWPHPLLPSEYVKRQIHVGFMDDYVALRNREITGTDCLVWGNDYPHYEGTWPESRAALTNMVAKSELSVSEQSEIFGGTVATIYGIQMPEEWPAATRQSEP